MRLFDADALADSAYELWVHGTPDIIKALMNTLKGFIDEAPTIEAEPVKHGRWVDNGIPESILSKCSVCGFSCGAYTFNYCPNCGAKMDGGAE